MWVYLLNFRLGETCSHVASVLYKIEKAVRIGITEQVCTDLPCTWNQSFTKNVDAAPVNQINFYLTEAKSKLLCIEKSTEVNPT